MEPLRMNLRAYTPEDFDTIQGWAEARGLALIPHLLSPNGFLVEDEEGPLLVAFGYILYDVPIIQVDHLLSRPHASAPSIREAWARIQATIVDWARRLNEKAGLSSSLIRGFTNPILSLESEKLGWQRTPDPLECIRYVVS